MAVLSRLRGFVFRDPMGGIDGQVVWFPVVSGPLALHAGVRVVAAVAVLFGLGGS
jgi:hypothetical protein